MEVRLAEPSEIPSCLRLRKRVFVEEQGVPPELESDGLDSACCHVVAWVEGQIAGTARLRWTPEGYAKAERVCVDPRFRSRRIGAALMTVLEAEVCAAGRCTLVLSAQTAVVPFYERLGYRGEGQTFLEANLPHLRMRKVFGGDQPNEALADRPGPR